MSKSCGSCKYSDAGSTPWNWYCRLHSKTVSSSEHCMSWENDPSNCSEIIPWECEHCGKTGTSKSDCVTGTTADGKKFCMCHSCFANRNSNSRSSVSSSYARVSGSMIALLLCVFLGWLGVHRFYSGRRISGVLYLFTLGVFGIGVIFDMFKIAYGHFEEHENRYGGYYCSELDEVSDGGKIFCWISSVVYAVIILATIFGN